jgi:4'-phosphopantetheinyl transferase
VLSKEAAHVDDPTRAVVVWLAHFPQLHEALPALETLLDARERDRAGRFRFPEDKARFIAGRGLLRHALRRYAPQAPAGLELTYSPLGRPLVPGQLETPNFSISHTHEMVALAFAHGAQVGIDLEHFDAKHDALALGERIMSEDDFPAFAALPDAEKAAAFYRVWTRKEAYLKARGEGITSGLREVSVPFTEGATTLVADRREPAATHWLLHALPVPNDYAGCVACDEPTRPVVCFSVRTDTGELKLDLMS